MALAFLIVAIVLFVLASLAALGMVAIGSAGALVPLGLAFFAASHLPLGS